MKRYTAFTGILTDIFQPQVNLCHERTVIGQRPRAERIDDFIVTGHIRHCNVLDFGIVQSFSRHVYHLDIPLW